MARYTTETITPKFHDALVDWQKRNFPEFEFLEKNWTNHFAKQTPFELVAKIGKLKSDTIDFGRFSGKPRIQTAAEMTGNMFYSARDIIRAQCSTELGSIAAAPPHARGSSRRTR